MTLVLSLVLAFAMTALAVVALVGVLGLGRAMYLRLTRRRTPDTARVAAAPIAVRDSSLP